MDAVSIFKYIPPPAAYNADLSARFGKFLVELSVHMEDSMSACIQNRPQLVQILRTHRVIWDLLVSLTDGEHLDIFDLQQYYVLK